MWIDAFITVPNEDGDYLVICTPDHRNFFIHVEWYSVIDGWTRNYFVYAWQPLPAFPDFLPEDEK